MKQWIRLIALLMLVALCVTSFVACQVDLLPPDGDEEQTDPDGETPGTNNNDPDNENEDNEDDMPQLLNPENAMLLVTDKKSDYAIVYDNNIAKDANSLINGFRNAFWTKTGVDLKTRKDNEAAQAKEILIYAMDDRREVSNMMGNLRVPNGKGYYIGIEDEKIVVACDDVMYLEPALELLLDAVRDCGNGMFGIQKGYTGKLDIPAPVTSVSSNVEMKHTGERNYTIHVTNVTEKNYTDYCAALDRMLDLYSTNQIGDNRFATYIKDGWNGRMAAYTMYYPNDKSYKITYCPLEYLPSLKATPDGDATVTPSITQNARDGAEQSLGYSAPGMCHIVQISDGRFILMDSGPYNEKDASSKDDVDNLYNMLKRMTPDGGTPVIAAWFFSHAHGDHMQLANAFLDRYANKIELQMVGYNFPDATYMPNEGNFGGMANNVSTFKAKVASAFPKAETWVCHSGEILMLPGCKVEIIYTPEDFSTDPDLGLNNGEIKFPSGNHTCTIFRLTVNETVFLVLGDAEQTLCKWVGENYKSSLKSDILSVSHHGSNGGELKLYQYIDPDICFWPVDKARFDSSKWQTYYDYNRYLLTARVREHYTASETKTIYC